MADGTTSSESHENLCCGFSAIPRVEDDVFLINDATLIGRHIAAIEASGNLVIKNLIRRCTWPMISDQVSCKLQNRKLIKWHIAVERINNPLAVCPDFTEVIKVNAMGVSISSIVKPMASTMFTPLKFREECVHESFVGIGMRIKNKRLNNCGFWWKASKVI